MLYDSALPEEEGYPRSLLLRNILYALKLWRRGESVQKKEEDYWLFQPFRPIIEVDMCINRDIDINQQLHFFSDAINAINRIPDGDKNKWANTIRLYKSIDPNLIERILHKNAQRSPYNTTPTGILTNARYIISSLMKIPLNDELAFIEESNKKRIDILPILKTLIKIINPDFFENNEHYSKKIISAKAALHIEKNFELRNIIESINLKISEKRKERIFEKHSIHFKRAEKKHEVVAHFFMGSTALLALLAILWVLNIHCNEWAWEWLKKSNSCTVDIKDIKSIHHLIYLISERGVFVAILFTIIFACLRGYFANSHNKTLNNHRYNCLKTFQYFNEISPDPYLTMKAVDSVFDHLPTGFTKLQSNKGEEKKSLVERIELFNALNKAK